LGLLAILRQAQKGERSRTISGFAFGVSCLVLFSFFVLSGCGPKYTYPASKVPESIEKICLKEYKIQVQARVVGKTVGALVVLDALLDSKGQVLKEVHETMGHVIQVVSRVALSTDLPIDFCTVFLRDKANTTELFITRSVDDLRRANADVIGVEESINRTLFGQTRAKPEELAQGEFVLKEVKLEDFLADQMTQRIRFAFSKELVQSKDPKSKEGSAEPSMVLVDGAFDSAEGSRTFGFAVIALKEDNPREMVLNIFKTIETVLRAYRFTSFEVIEIRDYLNKQKLVVDLKTFGEYQNKKITDEELLSRYLLEFDSTQEAFELFGFNR
jgi:hypothetical protein